MSETNIIFADSLCIRAGASINQIMQAVADGRLPAPSIPAWNGERAWPKSQIDAIDLQEALGRKPQHLTAQSSSSLVVLSQSRAAVAGDHDHAQPRQPTAEQLAMWTRYVDCLATLLFPNDPTFEPVGFAESPFDRVGQTMNDVLLSEA